MAKVIKMGAAKKAIESKKYKDLVMTVFKDMERQEVRSKQGLVSEVRRKARNTL
jgi:hypothetical protein